MIVIDDRLCKDDGTPYPFVKSPNTSGRMRSIDYLVMHYTAGSSAESAVRTLTSRRAKASAHLVIGRDGSITQLVPFNIVAWHAGRSSWLSVKGLNKYSIGIELDNTGPLTKSGGVWKTWFGASVDDAEVLEAAHKNNPSHFCGWQLYTPEQLAVSLEVAEALEDHYNFKDILGHDDIAPRRKTDPGPAFPIDHFRSRLFGRGDDEEEEKTYVTTVRLNIRLGPGLGYSRLPEAPLPRGTRLEVLDEEGIWKLVNVLDEVKGTADLEGWVHGNYIEAR